MEGRELQRVELLLGKEETAWLKERTVFVAGVGGVGSYAVEGLARTGIGHLILVDKDTVDITNLNRQIMATHPTVGQGKCGAMKERIHSYNPDCVVECLEQMVDAACLERIADADFAVDAIDTVSAKLDFIEACHRYGVPFVSSLGMGNRLDPSQVHVTDLFKTEGDPLARSVRSQARKRGIDYPVPVLFTKEVPLIQHQVVNPDGATRKDRMPPASTIFVPAAAGLLAASYCVRTLLARFAAEQSI